MKLIDGLYYWGTGAKGKFSGGFDITAFGGLQGGQKGMFAFPCFSYSSKK